MDQTLATNMILQISFYYKNLFSPVDIHENSCRPEIQQERFFLRCFLID